MPAEKKFYAFDKSSGASTGFALAKSRARVYLFITAYPTDGAASTAGPSCGDPAHIFIPQPCFGGPIHIGPPPFLRRRAGCRDERPCGPILRDFFWSCQKKPLRLQRRPTAAGNCAARRAVGSLSVDRRAAHLPPGAAWASPAVQGRWRLRSRRRRGVGDLRILPKNRRPSAPLRPRLRASTSPTSRGGFCVA